jgi:hypothetical protein
MKTLLAIMSYAGANETVKRHFPYWLKAQADILGVGHTDTVCEWPKHERFIGSVNICKDSHVDGPAHIVRFLELLGVCVHAHCEYDRFVIAEYDTLFFKPLPVDLPLGLNAVLAGGRSEEFHASRFFHTPWIFDRKSAFDVWIKGQRMLNCGLIEQGFIDRFLGLLLDLYDIPFTPLPGYTHNTVELCHVAEARGAIKAGYFTIHGVKTAECLQQITEGLA